MPTLVPAVLRNEPRFRLLFIGQLLSVLGDRVTMLVLPFAVLSVGGGPGGVVVVSVAQFLPFVLLALPAGDVEASVRAAASYLRRLKRSGEAVAVNLAFRAAALAPHGLVRLLSAVLGRRASLVFSNVVGPTAPVRLGGVGVRDLSFLVPQVSTIGLGVSALSYAGQVRVGFSADAATVPDLDALVAAFTERVRQLLQPGPAVAQRG